MKRLAALGLMLLFLLLAGCQTIHGFGQDMQHAGKWVQKKADKAD